MSFASPTSVSPWREWARRGLGRRRSSSYVSIFRACSTAILLCALFSALVTLIPMPSLTLRPSLTFMYRPHEPLRWSACRCLSKS
eukprot:4101769-Pleurochrysis_carterae.AAC.1